LNGKFITLPRDQVALSTGGSFSLANGDSFILEAIRSNGDIYFSLASGDDMSAYYEFNNGIQQTGNGYITDYGTSAIHDGAQLRVYLMNPYETPNEDDSVMGIAPDLVLEIQGSY
jgi:hypothetical protein